jgi:penicillin-binding protein 2
MNRDWSRQFPSRRNIFLIGGSLVFGGLALRLGHLQIVQGEEFAQAAQDNQIRLIPAPAHRGTIYDRAGRILAGSKRNFYVQLRRERAGGVREVADILDKLARVIPLTESRKRQILQEASQQAAFVDINVADDLTWEQFSQINVMAPELTGVSAEVGELRSYPFQGAFYHTVGYVAKASEKDILRITEQELTAAKLDPKSEDGRTRAAVIRRLYKHPEMRVGRQGLEVFAENALKGEPGKIRVLQNANGRVIDRLPSDDLKGVPGRDIVLNLDAELQNYAISRFGNESGTAVVIDVKTGAVLCMMSTPPPDPNAFVSGIGYADYKALQDDERIPVLHKAYDGRYPPGSTFKIVVAAAALEAGVHPEDSVYCSGRAYHYGRPFHCWKPEGHGRVNLHTAIQKSCDSYFYEMGKRIGIEKIAEVGKKFGMMHRYELGISGGKAGVMPNDEWKRARYKEQWWPGDTISAAIGQGYVEATPFELAVMTARIAGGASTPNPHLVASGVDVPDQTIVPFEGVSERTLQLVRAGMFAVTAEPGGTAYNYLKQGQLDPDGELPAPYTGARMAGKSGSAQVRKIELSERNARGEAISNDKLPWHLRDHALFVAYAPHDDPRYAISIVVEHGGSGSGVAAPFAKDILAHCLKFDPGAKPVYKPEKQVASVPAERT